MHAFDFAAYVSKSLDGTYTHTYMHAYMRHTHACTVTLTEHSTCTCTRTCRATLRYSRIAGIALWSLCGWLFPTFRGSSGYLYGSRALTMQRFLFSTWIFCCCSLEALKNRHGIRLFVIYLWQIAYFKPRSILQFSISLMTDRA